ncbi:hypothetical protein ACGFXC_04415 [Streptomyces sp. NPDC048507]|uniref:hypothetical protein n=1 Tax=Streptomyces sp. NPDC048507 TaxID=3365560 RepID=UPI003711ADF0
MTGITDAKGPQVPPTHPPRTPPPPKRPVEAPRPQPGKGAAVDLRKPPRLVVRDRRTAALTFPADRWAAAKAARQAVATVRAWRLPVADDGDLATAVRLFVDSAAGGGGKRVSVHLGDRDGQVLALVLGHRTAPASAGCPDGVLGDVAAMGTVTGCGTDSAGDGRRLWAVIDTTPQPGATA